jgi:RNA polymerase sigma factor (sigma-70 family)
MIYAEVVLRNLPMANKLVSKYAVQQPARHDEILSAAYDGLVKAARKRNPANSYVAWCVRGEIKNILHSGGSLTRSERAFLARYLDCEGNMADRADALGLSHEDVFHRLATITHVLPLYDHCNIACKPDGNLDELLEVCLSFLPARLHWAFLLKYRDQLSYPEISQRIGISLRSVSNHLRQALRILRLNKQRLADILF